MNYPTICIDLGASYTKVGFLPECAPRIGAPFEQEARVLLVDGSPLIPSLAVQTKRSKKSWLFGREAAEFRPTAGSVTHTNWKAGLYRPDNNAEAAHATVIAQMFFGWLRDELTPHLDDWALYCVRVTLPAFANGANLEGVVRKCLALADWNAGEIVITTEPHANAIGLMTVGRNVVTRGKVGTFTDFGRMFGQGNPYIRTARAAVISGSTQRDLRVAVIDIGAFTTDLAILEFDVTSMETSDDGLAELEQESFAVGTHDQLDGLFWEKLESEHGDVVEKLAFGEREELKRRVFSSGTFSITVDGKRNKFGSDADTTAAAEAAKQFADKIWKSIRKKFEAAEADVVYLTGGGSKIASVAEHLKLSIQNIAKQPAVAMGETSSGTNWRKWRNSGEGLDRLATAIGGVSVIAPRPLSEVRIGLKPRAQRITPVRVKQDSFRACTCHGNPDCPRCKGTGYITT